MDHLGSLAILFICPTLFMASMVFTGICGLGSEEVAEIESANLLLLSCTSILAIMAIKYPNKNVTRSILVAGSIVIVLVNAMMGFDEPFRLDSTVQAIALLGVIMSLFMAVGTMSMLGIEKEHAKRMAEKKTAALAALDDRRRASKNIPRIHVHEPHRLSPDTVVPIYCDTCGTMHEIRARNVHPHEWHCEPCRVLIENHWLD